MLLCKLWTGKVDLNLLLGWTFEVYAQPKPRYARGHELTRYMADERLA
jgi:hypothetical protein